VFALPLHWQQCKDAQLQRLATFGVCTQAHRNLKQLPLQLLEKYTTQRAHLDSEGHALKVKSLRCFISLLHLFLMSLSVFFSRIEPGTLHGIFGSVTADAEARLILNARAILF
jgi:hypothetical protein